MSPAALIDDEIQTFLTLLVPYHLDPFQREQLRAAVRQAAAAHLFGALADLIDHDQVTTDTVTTAIQDAIAAGIGYQRSQLDQLDTAA